MNARVIDDIAEVTEQAWDALAFAAPTPTIFQTWAWHKAWAQAWNGHDARVLRIVVVQEGQELRAILPLVLQGKILRFLGEGSADRLDLLYDPSCPGALAEGFRCLLKFDDWEQLVLERVPDASPTWRHLKAVARETGLFPLSGPRQALRGLSLEGHEDGIRRSLNNGLLARRAGVLASSGKVSVTHARAPREGDVPWDDIFIKHIHRWSLRAEPSFFAARPWRDFCRSLQGAPSIRATMILTTVLLDGRPVAWQLGFARDRVFYAFLAATDISVRKAFPADALWREVAAHALESGCRDLAAVFSEDPAVSRYVRRTATARGIRFVRSRRQQWLRRTVLGMGRLPFFSDAVAIGEGFIRVVEALFFGKKIVRSTRDQLGAVDSFRGFYENKAVTSGSCPRISRPEVELLRRLRPELKEMRVLDMGLGEGRTGVYFAPAVRTYTAFDHARPMVTMARASLDDQLDPLRIVEGDARKMSFAQDGAYDLILFSGEGLDESSPDDRARIFQEVRRVGRAGAVFFFSSRNLQGLGLRGSCSATGLLRRWRRGILMSVANPNLARLRRQASSVLFDESGSYRLPVYYVTPKEQVRLLKGAGFHDIRVFASRTGLEVRDWRLWDKVADDTVYYLCRV